MPLTTATLVPYPASALGMVIVSPGQIRFLTSFLHEDHTKEITVPMRMICACCYTYCFVVTPAHITFTLLTPRPVVFNAERVRISKFTMRFSIRCYMFMQDEHIFPPLIITFCLSRAIYHSQLFKTGNFHLCYMQDKRKI